EEASARTAEESMEFNRKLQEIAHANIHAYFEWLHELARANSSSEFVAVCMKHSRQQFETYRQQTRELASLAQGAAIENMGPFGIVFGMALIGRPDFGVPYPWREPGRAQGDRGRKRPRLAATLNPGHRRHSSAAGYRPPSLTRINAEALFSKEDESRFGSKSR